MYIITFYSFKGGVGRTMALVNVGAELARRGRKVLLVDFDLEAPGLSTYNRMRPPKGHPGGIVEYVTKFRRERVAPLVSEFIYQANEGKPVGKRGGELWVLPAGRNGTKEYRRMLHDLNWRKLYDEEEGFLLFEDTKAQWEEYLKPDYVLIDSRTGHTDVEGICTRQLADAVVLVFYPNAQNLAGLTEVYGDIRLEATTGLKKNIKIHFVASNVPDLDDEDQRLRKQLRRFESKVLGKLGPAGELDLWKNVDLLQARASEVADREVEETNDFPPTTPVIHRNETLQMMDQPIFVLDRPRTRLAKEYRSLVHRLQIENLEDRDGALLFLREVQKKKPKLIDSNAYELNTGYQLRVGREKYMVAPVGNRLNRITEQFWSDPEVLYRVGQYLLQHKETTMALKRFNRVLTLQPKFGDALLKRASCHRMLHNDTEAANDLHHFLRDHSMDVLDYENKITLGRNETVLLELLSISLEEFLKTLDSISAKTWTELGLNNSFWLLSLICVRLIQERRWPEALRFLENNQVERRVEEGSLVIATLKPFRAFLLAMIQWGRAGKPDAQFCSLAIQAYEVIVANFDELLELDDPYAYFRMYGSWHQDLSLLYWGVGDTQKAKEALDLAFARLDRIGGPYEHEVEQGVSSWSFQETTAPEYRNDLKEMRRMIEGEAVRPAFLGSATSA